MKLPLYVSLILFMTMATLCESQDSPELVIYFTDVGQIVKVHLHHMNFTVLPLTNLPAPGAIDYDTVGEHVYWTDTSLKQIRRAGKDGENDTIVAQLSNSSHPSGITVDSISRLVFFTDMGDGVVGKIDMNTFRKTVIINTDLTRPRGIVAHTKNKELFWVDSGSDKKLQACDYDGNNRRTVVDTKAFKPHGIALDPIAGRLYWADGAGRVKSVLMNGNNVVTVLDRRGFIFNDISIFNGYIYLTMLNNVFLLAMSVHGEHLSTLSSRSFQFPNGIHAFSPNFNVTTVCDDYKYGTDCVKCGNCVANHICEKTTGICVAGCVAGYQAEMCVDTCEPGTWGPSCDNECGYCREGTICDIYNGLCPSGCMAGYKAQNCTIACGPATYGNPCKDCGKCSGGVSCDEVTGKCPSGCQRGWAGELCNKRCGENTWGQCVPCGFCAEGTSCDSVSGVCSDGCQPQYEGKRCDQKKRGKSPGRSDSKLAIGLGVGFTIVALAIAGVLLFFCIRKRRGEQAAPSPVVKMERSPGKEPTQENDYTTIETIGTTAIIRADELSEQTDIVYQQETQSTA